MYAIIQDGGRQYRVQVGQVLDVDYRVEEAKLGPTGIEFRPKEIRFDQVLAIRDGSRFVLGQPTIESASVLGEVLGVVKAPKIYIQKFRRRKNSRRRKGHRQLLLQVKIKKIELGSAAEAMKEAAVSTEAATPIGAAMATEESPAVERQVSSQVSGGLGAGVAPGVGPQVGAEPSAEVSTETGPDANMGLGTETADEVTPQSASGPGTAVDDEVNAGGSTEVADNESAPPPESGRTGA